MVMTFWHVTVTAPKEKGYIWSHVYAVMAPDAESAQLLALERAPVVGGTAVAVVEHSRALKVHSYSRRG
jgi:hypothetical protein